MALRLERMVTLGLVVLFIVGGCGGDDGEKSESVTLLAPPENTCEDLRVTFQWRIEDRRDGVTYCSNVITDKGTNPFDGSAEEIFHAYQRTELEVLLTATRYDPATFEWGVRVTACDAQGASCPCQGRSFDSTIRRLRTSSQAPNCP